MDKQIATFIRQLKQLGYGKVSVRNIESAVKEFTSQSNILQANEITREAMERHLAWLQHRPSRKGGGLAGKTIHWHFYALRLFADYLLAKGVLQSHPLNGLQLPAYESYTRAVPSLAEIEAMYAACQTPRERAMLAIYYGCGLRRHEGEKLNVKDVQFGRGLLHVRHGKGYRRRSVPMSNRVATDLRHYLKNERPKQLRQNHPTTALVLNTWGQRMRGTSYDVLLKRLNERAKIRHYTLHSLRHGIATHLLAKGLHIERVRDFLGHACLESTQIYTHVGEAGGENRESRLARGLVELEIEP